MQKKDEFLEKMSFDVLAEAHHIHTFDYIAKHHSTYVSLTLDGNISDSPAGWKIHLSVDDSQENSYQKTWNTVVPIIMNHKISLTKLMLPTQPKDMDLHPNDQGKHITIYYELNNDLTSEQWNEHFNELTTALTEA